LDVPRSSDSMRRDGASYEREKLEERQGYAS
jgi:hypothetical protein